VFLKVKLEMSVRRRRHDRNFRDAKLADLAQLPIQVDPQTDQQAWSATLRLAERHRLTVYDSVYLELALGRNLPSATPGRRPASCRECREGASVGMKKL
jgi:predicted nucleic acid-binding protein